jgi:hypothetical protein
MAGSAALAHVGGLPTQAGARREKPFAHGGDGALLFPLFAFSLLP